MDNKIIQGKATASGTATYTANLSLGATSYVTDGLYIVTFISANTGASTLNLNSLGAVPIVKGNGRPLVAGDISNGLQAELLYDGSNFNILNVRGEISKLPRVGTGIFNANHTLNAGVSAPTMILTGAATTTTGSSYVVTLNPSSTENSNFTIIYTGGKVSNGHTLTIFDSATSSTIFTIGEGQIYPTKVQCLWDGSAYHTIVSYDEEYNPTGGNFGRGKRIISASYDFSTLGGAVSIISLNTTIPNGAVLFPQEGWIEARTPLTSAGTSLVAWGSSNFFYFDTGVYTDAKYTSFGNTNPRCAGFFNLTGGGAGSVDEVNLSFTSGTGFNILTDAVPFNTSLTQTAADVVEEINRTNANGFGFTAVQRGTTIYLLAPYQSGEEYFDLEVDPVTTTITASVTPFQIWNAKRLYRNSTGTPLNFTLQIIGDALTAGEAVIHIPYIIDL